MGDETVAFVSELSEQVDQLFHAVGAFGHKSFTFKSDSANKISDVSPVFITSFKIIKNLIFARFLGRLGLYVAEM